MKNNKKIQKKAVATKAKTASVKKVTKPSKPLKNNVKKAVKAPVKAAVKKPVAKMVKKPMAKVTKTPVKAVKAPAKPVKAVAKMVAKPIAKPVAQKAPVVKAPAKAPIMVKAPMNQNKGNQNKGSVVTKTAAKSPVVMQRTAEGLKPVSSNSMHNRPAYRPIQVINKPLPSTQPVRAMAPAPANEKVEYKKGDYVVYPAHGVGQIEAVESQIISGMDIKLYAIVFEKDRMRLKVPVFKAHASGLRRLSSPNQMQDAMKTLQGRAHVRRVMWSRRAQEYETKINSGDPVSIAEVLRDLKRSNDDNEQSYSERQIYQSALERLAREVAALERITEIEASEKLEVLIKGKRAVKVEEPVKAVEADIAIAETKEAKAA